MISFSDLAKFALGSLPWAGGKWGTRLREAIGLLGDALGDACLWAGMAPWVRNPFQPEDARQKLGQERRMPRYLTESDSQHRARLDIWRETYRNGGSAATLLAQLEAFGFPGCSIATHATPGWEAVEPVLHPVTGTPWWSLFWIIVPEGSHPFQDNTWGWDDPLFGWDDVVGFGPDIEDEQVAALKALIKRWKPSNWVCEAVVFELSTGDLWVSIRGD